MGPNLRTRLLLSFGLLILVVMVLFSTGALAGLLRNPLVYEDAAQKLRTAQRAVITRAGLFPSLESNANNEQLTQAAGQLNVRLVLLGADGIPIADSEAEAGAALRIPALRLQRLAQRNEITFMRDTSNRIWLALVQQVDEQATLVIAVRRPGLAFLRLFNSEFLRPVLLTGMIGLALAVLISLRLVGWISAPLKRIEAAADEVAAGRYKTIDPSGPSEVRRLANAFNRMVTRVEQAQRSQRELIANVSHELKTPLTSIQGFTQAILDGVSTTPEEVNQAAQVISNESHRMSRLVQDLVSLARLEADTADLQRTRVDVIGLVQAVVEKFRPLAEQAGLDLQVEFGELPMLMGDEDRLAQVLSNLIDNAIKYTPSGRQVQISARGEGEQIEIRVADTGVGIPAGEREHIFQRFYRADGSRPGMGLGLAITRQIVLAHGGSIRVQDNQPQGSVFVVMLPVDTVIVPPVE